MKNFKIPEQKTVAGSAKPIAFIKEMVGSDSTDESPQYRATQQRKSPTQIYILEKEFYTCRQWDKKKVEELAKSLGLTALQVYKWRWDYQNKLKPPSPHKASKFLECSETLGMSEMTKAVHKVKDEYQRVFNHNPAKFSPSFYLNLNHI